MRKILGIAVIAALLTTATQSCKKKETGVKGCKDPSSLNYNKDATVDDGSCQIVDKNQRYFIMDVTGTWCPPCGTYGIPGFEKAIELIGDKNVVAFSAHSSDVLSCTAGNELAAYAQYKSNSVPRIAGGSTLIFPAGVYSDINATANKIKSESDKVTTMAPVVNCYVGKSISGNSVTLNVKAKFLAAGNGDYYIAAYITENGIVSPQKLSDGSTKSDQIHNHVLRTAFGPTFGESLSSGAAESGKLISKTFTTTLNSSWKVENLHYAVIIWKKDGSGVYKFENCTQI